MASLMARRQLRLAALAALQSQAGALGADIQSPGNVPTPAEKLPAILLRTADEEKSSTEKGVVAFTSTITLEIEARDQADTAEEAQDKIEALGAAIEDLLFTWAPLLALVDQVASVHTTLSISADGRQHLAELKMSLQLETFEEFEPAPETALASIGVHLDTTAPVDGAGTYPAPTAPPYAPAAAPRQSGPDGRDEGALDIDIAQ
jgi:hypothetical protein